MNITNILNQRRFGFQYKFNIEFALDQIKPHTAYKLRDIIEDDVPNDLTRRAGGPMSSAKIGGNLIALGCEDGSVQLIDLQKFKSAKQWSASQNAIFDLATQPGTNRLLTASGDILIKLWDLESCKDILELKPHDSAIKSVSFYDTSTLCSGSRDGTIRVHDIRQKEPTILIINEAHRNESYSKKKAKRPRDCKSHPLSCVTSTVFDSFIPRIYSSGANDATIKIWDLRKLEKKTSGKYPTFQPFHAIHHPTKGLNCGYSQLLYTNCKLLAGCSDNNIYCYSNILSDENPVVYIGFDYEPYYKIDCLDDKLLVAGSGFGGALIWSLEKRTSKPVGRLCANLNGPGDTSVVVADWSTISIMTFRDDFLACKWTIDRGLAELRSVP